MPRSCSITLAIAALALAAGACGSTAASPPRPAAAPGPSDASPGLLPRPGFFIPGEAMSFRLSLLGVEGGEARLAVGLPGTQDGRRQLVVRSQLASTGVGKLVKKVRDDVTTRVDLDTGAPIAVDAELLFGERLLTLHTRISGPLVSIEYKRSDTTRMGQRRLVMPAGHIAYDAHAALGAIRAWEPRKGQEVLFHLVSGRFVWRGNLVCTGTETIRTAMGLYPAIRLEGTAVRMTSRLQVDPAKKPRSYVMWISDDANRLPLRVAARTEYGDVEVELTSYQRPEP